MPLRVDAVLSPAEPLPPGFAAAVVVDVIRATTTAAYLLQAGAERLLLAGDEASARREAARRGALLAGERGGVALPGFDLGNSPREAEAAAVAGREVVMTTTNGTVAALRAARAVPAVALGALVNASAVASWAAGHGSLLLVAAGREGRVALDDTYAIGAIVDALADLTEIEPSDGARLARQVYASGDAADVLTASAAARALAPVGLAADVAVCARRDALRLVPVLQGASAGVLEFAGAVF